MVSSTNASQLAEGLRGMPPGSAVLVRMKGATYTDSYFAALSAVLREYAMETKGYVVYLSVTNPASLLVDILSSVDIPIQGVSFIDVTSYMMVDKAKRAANTTYVESPTMLETIMLRVEYLLRRSPNERRIVVLDSISSLAIHNNSHILQEFLHILVNKLKSMGAVTVLLTVIEETAPELSNVLSLISDANVTLEGGGQS